MELKVKYDELAKTGNVIRNKDEELKNVLDNIQRIIDELPDAWEGVDCDIFVKNSTEYIKQEKEKRKKVELLGEILARVSGNYKDKDTEWEEKMKKESRINEYFDQGRQI